MLKSILLWLALAVALSAPATCQVAILQIQVTEGEGIVHPPGARSARPLSVEVTDETGRPVVGAAVSFHLPDEGPGGMFPNGLRTEVAVTDARGRAAMHAFQSNRTPGRFQIRIVASKEQARAGIVSFQYVAETSSGAASPRRPAAAAPAPTAAIAPSSGVAAPTPAPVTPTTPVAKAKGHGLWITVAAIVGGGAVAGVLAARSGSKTPAPPAPAAITASPTLTIGNPTTTVGKP